MRVLSGFGINHETGNGGKFSPFINGRKIALVAAESTGSKLSAIIRYLTGQ